MKKKLLSVLLSTTMVASVLTACGSSNTTTTEATATEAPVATEATEAPATEAPAATETTEAPAEAAADEGKVLNIQCWNDEFANRLTSHYPGYVANDPADVTKGGKIGDVEVKFTITPSTDNAYQNNLDSVLPTNADAAADDKVDIFLVEADYALKYVNADVSMPVADLGITDADLADQYQYTKDIVTDSNGVLKGISWQAASAGLIYNREAAKAIIGSDDPADVQAAVSDWSKFNELAAKAQEAGYAMCSCDDTYRVYSNNVTTPWVVDGKVVVDDNLKAWVDDSKKLIDAKQETTNALWGDDWGKAKYPDGKTFCYFGPAWFFNFCLAADDASSIAANGGWGYVVGPQSYYWGGTWICGAAGTDNPALVKDVMLKLCTDPAIMKDIAQQDADCVNNKTVLAELAADDSGNLALLGGQNPYAQLAEGAEKVDMSNITDYDQGCNEKFQAAMRNYFDNNATYDEALAQFYTAIQETYPSLTVE